MKRFIFLGGIFVEKNGVFSIIVLIYYKALQLENKQLNLNEITL